MIFPHSSGDPMRAIIPSSAGCSRMLLDPADECIMPVKPKLDLDTKIAVRTRWLEGRSLSDLQEEFKLSHDLVTKILNDDDIIAKRLAAENIQKKLDVETEKIMEIKDKTLDFIRATVQEAETAENKHLFIDKIVKALEAIDKVQRLNQNRATDIKEERKTTTNFDVANVLKELKTPEDQKAFLRKQLEDKLLSSPQ